MSTRLKVGLAAWFVLSVSVASAEPPCVEISLPDGLLDAAEWEARIRMEATALEGLDAGPDGCASLSIVDEGADGMSVLVSHRGRTTRSALALDDVLPVHHARVAALVTQALLRAIMEPLAAPAPAPRVHQVTVVRAPITLSTPEPSKLSWNFMLGSRLFVTHQPPLGRAELGAQWATRARSRVRYGMALVADLTTATASPGRVIAASVGLRGGVSLGVYHGTRTHVWLGPHAELNALIVSARARSQGDVARTPQLGALTADMRLSVDFPTTLETRPTVALDLGGVIHALQLTADSDPLLSYVGAYGSVSVGVSFNL